MSLISQKSCFKRDNGRKLIGDSECREPSGDVLLQMGSNQKLAEVGSKEGFYKTGEIITGLKVDEDDSDDEEDEEEKPKRKFSPEDKERFKARREAFLKKLSPEQREKFEKMSKEERREFFKKLRAERKKDKKADAEQENSEK